MSAKMSQDAKKDEFRKYLEKAGVLDLLTKSLVSLYEEPEKPNDALSYLRTTVGGSVEDKDTITKLREENEELKKKVTSIEISQAALEARILELSKVEVSPAEPLVAESVAKPAETEATLAPPAEDMQQAEPAPKEVQETEKPTDAVVPAAPAGSEEPMETENETPAVSPPVTTPAVEDEPVSAPAPGTESKETAEEQEPEKPAETIAMEEAKE